MTAAPLLCVALLLAGGPAGSRTSQPAQAAATVPASAPASAPAGPQLRVLCTTFPIYLFARNVAAGRDNLHLSLLLPAAMGCPHDYVVTPQDMQRIAAADAVIVNGLGMEEFIGPALERANPKAVVIDSSKGISDILYMGDEGEHHHHAAPEHPTPQPPRNADAHDADRAEGGDRKRTANPHLFASPAMAAKVVANIAEGLAGLDPGGAERYRSNALTYAASLAELGRQFSQTAAKLANRKIVTEHAVFDYLGRDAGLEIVAVVQESPGQEPAAAEMIDLVRLVARSGAGAIFTEPQYPAKVAQTIAAESGVPVAVLDPLATGPADAPLDYYQKVMAANLRTLIKTLGQKEPPR